MSSYCEQVRKHFDERWRPRLVQRWQRVRRGTSIYSLETEQGLSQGAPCQNALETLERTAEDIRTMRVSYVQPVLDHINPFISAESGGSTISFEDDVREHVHLLCMICIPRVVLSKTLDLVFTHFAMQAFGSSDHESIEHTDTSFSAQQHARERFFDLLRTLSDARLAGSEGRKSLGVALTTAIECHVKLAYAEISRDGQESVAQELRRWAARVFHPFAEGAAQHLGYTVGVVEGSKSTLSSDAVLEWLGRLRVKQLFDIIVRWPSTIGAMKDVKVGRMAH